MTGRKMLEQSSSLTFVVPEEEDDIQGKSFKPGQFNFCVEYVCIIH